LKGLLYPARYPPLGMLRSFFFPSIIVITPIFPIDQKEYVLDGKCNFKIPKTTYRLLIHSLLHFSTSSSTVSSTFCVIMSIVMREDSRAYSPLPSPSAMAQINSSCVLV